MAEPVSTLGSGTKVDTGSAINTGA